MTSNSNSKKIRATIAGYVAGLLNLEERAGAEVIETKRNGSGTRVTIELTDDAADRVLDEFTQMIEGIKNEDNTQRFTKDQLRSIERAAEAVRVEWVKLGGVESVGPDGGEYIAPAPANHMTMEDAIAFVNEVEPAPGVEVGAGQEIADVTQTPAVPGFTVTEAARALAEELAPNKTPAVAMSAEKVFVWNDVPKPSAEVDMTSRKPLAAQMLDQLSPESRKRVKKEIARTAEPAGVDASENSDKSSGNWWDAPGVSEAIRYRIRSAKLSVDATAERAKEAEKIKPAPKNLAALRAVATRAQRQYDALIAARPDSLAQPA